MVDAGGSRLSQAHRMNETLHDRLTLLPGRPRNNLGAAATFADGEGHYADLVHVFLAAARSIGMPARYVSGHLFRRHAEAVLHEAAHGWAEAWVDDMGWIGFDPASGMCPDDAYVHPGLGPAMCGFVQHRYLVHERAVARKNWKSAYASA
jgi:transglutaminase-like putative cysteine protease